ncbi:MAG: hypothetical protein II670_00955 [Alphaproteobacteria bacterium]|nr:hypothetical protein [Alphaproteobacteria bacterium]
MISKDKIEIGKKVWYAAFLDDNGNPDCEMQEATITTEPYEMCGTVCCMISTCSSVVDIENLFEIRS